MNLSPDQEAALAAARRGALVLTAAAGSGKTAVLVARVMRYLEQGQGASLNRALIVTFTDKAAQEMRSRLGQELIAALADPARNAIAQSQLELLPHAQVETFHAFGNHLIRRYGHTIGQPQQLSVVDPLTQAQLWLDAWQEAVSRHPDQRVRLARHWDERTQPLTRQALRRLIEFARSMPDPEGFLGHLGSEFSDEQRLHALIDVLTTDLSRQAGQWQGQVAQLADTPIADRTLGQATSRLAAALAELADGNWQAVSEDTLPKRLAGLTESDREVWDQLRAIAKTARETARGLRASTLPGALAAEAMALAPVASAVSELSVAWLAAYQGIKRQRRLIDYDDQLQLAYQILTTDGAPSAVARELAAGLDVVLVDEYQDTNPLQDALLDRILRATSTPPRLLVVGDHRQSIYRFRHALPELLATLAERLPVRGQRLEMAENFRSRPEILAAVQAVTGDFPGIEGAAPLVPARDASSYPHVQPPFVEVWALERAPGDAAEVEDDQAAVLERPEAEAGVIGRAIGRWCADGELIFDRQVGLRPMRPSDVAVLVRSAQSVGVFQEVFSELGLPSQIRSGRRPRQSLEWQTMESLVAVAADTYTELDLAAVLRSPIVGVGLDELAAMVLSGGPGGLAAGVSELDARTAGRIRTWQSWRWLPVGELVARLLHETAYADRVLNMAHGPRRHHHLLAFLDWAEAFSQGWPGGPQAFVEASREGAGDVFHDRPQAGTPDAVQILTIHQAKGLEFPVVVLAASGVELPFLSHRRKAPYLAIHRHLGIGLLAPDPERAVRRLTPLATGIETALAQEDRQEEARLLYVAMTRAQDRLVVVGTVRDRMRAIGNWRAAGRLQPARRWASGRSYLDWVAPVALQTPGIVSLSWPTTAPASGFSAPAASPPPAWPQDLWDERLELADPGAPEVVTATSLAEGDLEVELESHHQSVVALPGAAALQPAAVGTATHLLLRHLRYPKADAVAEITRQCQELVAAEVLLPDEASHIDIAGLAALFVTPVGRRLAAEHHLVQREVPFTLLAEEPVALAGSLLHGQIDALLVGMDDVLVVDLKTDRISAQDASRRASQYKPQMHSYRRAVMALYPGRTVTVCLYFSQIQQMIIDPDLADLA